MGTASSLDRVVRGKRSHYVPMALSYGMAKNPLDYLAAVQRWAEGGVVLGLQTYFGEEYHGFFAISGWRKIFSEGTYVLWIMLTLFVAFVVLLWRLVTQIERPSLEFLGGIHDALSSLASALVVGLTAWGIFEDVYKDLYDRIILQVLEWTIG